MVFSKVPESTRLWHEGWKNTLYPKPCQNSVKLDLTDQFESIRDTFFPRWHRGLEWRVQVAQDLDGAEGRCERVEKTIYILDSIVRDPELELVLIHECCHAVTYDGHRKLWQERMLKAAKRAVDLGRSNLDEDIRAEAHLYSSTPTEQASYVYGSIKDALYDAPSASFDQIVDRVRRVFGLPKDKFLRRYRKCRDKYDQAIRELS